MKKSILLCIAAVLIACLAACTAVPAVTPAQTGAPASEAGTAAASSESAPVTDDSEPASEPVTESVASVSETPAEISSQATTAAVSSAADKTPSAKAAASSSKEPAKKTSSASASQATASAAAQDEPNININEFLSIEKFNQWATAEHFRAFFIERAMDEWADDDNEIVYCYPVGLNNYPDLAFQMTTLDEGSSAVLYWYDFADRPQSSQPSFNTGLTCFCGKLAHEKGLLDMMDKVAKRVKDGDKNCACIERDGITYYCSKSDDTKNLNVQWTQDDCFLSFHASLFSTKYSMDWEDIIPYLTVEKVTIPLQ